MVVTGFNAYSYLFIYLFIYLPHKSHTQCRVFWTTPETNLKIQINKLLILQPLNHLTDRATSVQFRHLGKMNDYNRFLLP